MDRSATGLFPVTQHAYPWRQALPDVLRAAAGSAMTAATLAFLSPPLWLSLVLTLLLVLFLLYGWQAVQRWRVRIEMDSVGIRTTNRPHRSLLWSALDGVTIRHYSEVTGGWFELVLRGSGHRLRINSQIQGFDVILRQAATVSRQRTLSADWKTRYNAATLGVPFDGAWREGDP